MSLSRRSVIYLALMAALGVIGVWNEALISFPAWKVACALLVAGLIYEWSFVSGRWPSVRVVEGESLQLGEATHVALGFANPASRPLLVEYVPALPPGIDGPRDSRELRLPANSEGVDRIPARGVALGKVAWEDVPARILGPLGLARWSKKLSLRASLDVRPDSLRGRHRDASSMVHGQESKTMIGGGIELHHLRPYRRGDPRSAIDWKATARSGELITRVFGEDQHLEIVIALDAGRTSRLEMDGMSQLAHYVNLAARFAEYAAFAEDRAGLVVFAERILCCVPPRRGLGGVRQVRNALHDLEPVPVESNLIQAALQIRSIARHRSLVVLLTDLYDRGANSQLARCIRMLLPNHLPIVAGIVSEDIAVLADAAARDWFDPYRSLAAREYQQDVESNIARLRRMGAYAVTARPRDIDGRVFALYESLRAKHLI